MPEWVYVSDIAQHQGQEVVLKGWLYNKRSSGKLHFLQVRDGTGVIQCVVSKSDVSPETFQLADHLSQESSLSVTGMVRADPRSPIGFELAVKSLAVGQVAQDYPITPKEHGIAFLLDHRHLWLRSARQHAILRVRSEVIRACRDYFDGHGFTLLDAPIFTRPARARPRCLRSIILVTPPTSPRAGSFTWKPGPWPLARSTVAVPRSGRRNPRPGAISPSSG